MSEIEDWNIDKTDNTELDDDESSGSENEAATEVKISHSEAIDNFNNLIKWCAQNEHFGIKHTFILMSLRSNIVTAHTTKETKLTTATKYFK